MRRISAFFTGLISLFGGSALAAEDSSQSFTPDPSIKAAAEAYALDAVDYAKKQFGVDFDWSDASIENAEKILSIMHDSFMETKPQPSEEQVLLFSKIFGSYVGEVYRRNHGATWGIVTLEGNKFPGLRADNSGVLFWPWSRASKRISSGPQDNLWHYYQSLLSRVGEEKGRAAFFIGQRVGHPTFGEGVVLDVAGEGDNARVAVKFSDGETRLLLLLYANLQSR